MSRYTCVTIDGQASTLTVKSMTERVDSCQMISAPVAERRQRAQRRAREPPNITDKTRQDKKRTHARTTETRRAASCSSRFKRLTRKTHLIWSAVENTIETAPRMTNDTPWLYTPRSRKLTSRVSPRLEVSRHRGTGATGDIMVLVRHALARTHSRPYISDTHSLYDLYKGIFMVVLPVRVPVSHPGRPVRANETRSH